MTAEKYLITRVQKGQTTTGKTVVNLYSKRLQHPVLYLFEPAELASVGIDHNGLGEDEHHVKFWAYYQKSDKVNGKGNPYLDILYLEPIDAPSPAAPSPAAGSADTSAVLDALRVLTDEVRAVKGLLVHLAYYAADAVDADDLTQAAGDLVAPEPVERPSPPPPPAQPLPNGKASTEQKISVRKLLASLGYERHDDALVAAGFVKLADLTVEQAAKAIKRLESAVAKKAAAAQNGR